MQEPGRRPRHRCRRQPRRHHAAELLRARAGGAGGARRPRARHPRPAPATAITFWRRTHSMLPSTGNFLKPPRTAIHSSRASPRHRFLPPSKTVIVHSTRDYSASSTNGWLAISPNNATCSSVARGFARLAFRECARSCCCRTREVPIAAIAQWFGTPATHRRWQPCGAAVSGLRRNATPGYMTTVPAAAKTCGCDRRPRWSKSRGSCRSNVRSPPIRRRRALRGRRHVAQRRPMAVNWTATRSHCWKPSSAII